MVKRRTDIIMTAAASAVVTAVVTSIIRDYQTIKAVRKVYAKGEADVSRIWKAAALVDAKLKRGDYDGRTVDDVMADFKYYQQVFNIQEQESDVRT